MTHFLLHSLSSCTFPCCISLTESAPDAPTLSFLYKPKNTLQHFLQDAKRECTVHHKNQVENTVVKDRIHSCTV